MVDHNDDSGLQGTPLGKVSDCPRQYAPQLLYPIPRQPARRQLGIEGQALPFFGEDIWNAYELSWLDPRGKPEVAQATFRVPADSPAIIESKSLKLYLNSLNQTPLQSRQHLLDLLQGDLSGAAGAPVVVSLADSDTGSPETLPGTCLDSLDIEVDCYRVEPLLLSAGGEEVTEQLHSHLLRSLCPVTGQPDWASVLVSYRGPAIDHAGLLRYLVSYRQHQAFHEQCVERMYLDIMERCNPPELSITARYLRRGGLDINPCRSSQPQSWANPRTGRQ